ncbi:MAG: alpha/beta hydrolase [Gammaproteobacteria bacterium]|nr:alpha/beta hydrolase [Pseudomonadales bacterium]MCP5348492.1 alpha/beta hydrolase [Pseudomonadales bacterium]
MSLIVCLAVLGLLLLAPLLIPVPEIGGTLPTDRLADPESRFIRLHGLQIHYRIAGQGEPVYLLLHGFAASVFSWREIMAPLAEQGTVIAFDRPAFGLSEKPLRWKHWNPYSSSGEVDIALALMDALGVGQVVVIGNSIGGTLAARLALQAPDRVRSLILVSPAMNWRSGVPHWLGWLLRTPQFNHVGPLLVRALRSTGLRLAHRAWHDPGLITPQIQAGYELPLRSRNWDRGLWNSIACSTYAPDLVARLADLGKPVLVITGADDRVVPTKASVALAETLNAQLTVIPLCGHIAQEECPEAFLAALQRFVEPA